MDRYSISVIDFRTLAIHDDEIERGPFDSRSDMYDLRVSIDRCS